MSIVEEKNPQENFGLHTLSLGAGALAIKLLLVCRIGFGLSPIIKPITHFAGTLRSVECSKKEGGGL